MNWPNDHEGMISDLMTNTSLSTFQAKLMCLGERRGAQSNI